MNQHTSASTLRDNVASMRSYSSWFNLINTIIPDYLCSRNIHPYPIANLFAAKWHTSIYYSLIYLLLVYYGTKLMKNREPFKLRITLAIWNGILTLFSIAGSIVVVPEFYRLLSSKGLVATYCNNAYIENSSVVFWYTMFSLSKLAELLDTAFIVLRKQKLIPLHWIHHVLTLIYTFYIYGSMAATARWMVTMNLIVHSVMYGYFCLRALKISVPKPIAVVITSSQIIQMIFGLMIHLHIVIRLFNGNLCDCPLMGATWGLLMYLLYFYFFVKFFFDSYLKSSYKMKLIKVQSETMVDNDDNNNRTKAKRF